jgi:cell division septal protein FtsQ
MKKKKTDLLVDALILGLVLAIALYFILRCLSGFLQSREYFNVKYIRSNDDTIDLSYLKGRNIFSLDLEKQAKGLRAAYPAYNSIRLTRYPPNGVIAEFKKRAPLAYIKLARYFLVGEEAVLFDGALKGTDAALPVITGLESKMLGAKPGMRYNIKELNLALELIRRVNNTVELKNYKISRINVSSADKMSFFIPNNVEIKIGDNDIAGKVKLLTPLLAHVGRGFSNVKYIDLRFKEPVIKYLDD